MVLLAVVISLSTAYVIIRAQRAPIWQIKLNNYVKYRNDILVKDPQQSGTVTIVKVTTASHPENFRRSGDKKLVAGNHYWLLENNAILLSTPEIVMCALLEQRRRTGGDTEAEPTYQLLFLVYFSHPREPEWLIYQGNDTAAVGCDLPWPP